MCGFAGVIAWDEKYRVSREVLARMSAAIAHRGPDGEGSFYSPDAPITPDRPQVALAHRRLAILDPDPRANQPFADHRGRQLVFNGEIYNFRELRAELSRLQPGYPWRTHCDTEVLLAAYDQWGEKCVEHFNGMFAFAIWDEPGKSLFLARDRMGQKPLYVARQCERAGAHGVIAAVAFASELAAIRQAGWDSAIESPPAVHPKIIEYLRYGCIENKSLPPAHTLSLTGNSKRYHTRRYFQHSATGPTERAWSALSHAERVAETRRLVQAAVAQQLVSDVPIGCFLSGGVDSSVIAACMRAATPGDQEVHTFAIAFDDPRYDESKFASQMAKHLGTTHHEFRVQAQTIDDLPKLAAVFGEPFADSSAIPVHYLARETRKHVKVALSGDGGDELFGGYDRYRALKFTEKVRSLPPPLNQLLAGRAAAAAISLLPGVHPKSKSSRVKRLMHGMSLDLPARYDSFIRLFDNETISQLVDGPIASPKPGTSPFELYLRSRDAVRAALAADRETYLPNDLLTKLDRASMLHALEVRSPFMDHTLVRFASTLTTDELLKGGPKRMLREAFTDDLPAWVFKRKKMGFAVPIGEWFRGELRPMLRDHLFAADSFASTHFNRAVVERLVTEHETQKADHAQRLYALLMLELWWKWIKQ